MYKATVKTVLDKSKAAMDKEGKFPIVLQVIYNRQPRKYAIGLRLTADEFEGLKKARSTKMQAVRIEIANWEKKAISIIEALPEFSFTEFKQRLSGKQRPEQTDFFEFFRSHIEKIAKEGREATAHNYKTALNSLMVGRSRLSFSEVTPTFIINYRKRMEEEGKSGATIGMYLRTLKVAVNEAIRCGHISEANYPFKGVKIGKATKRQGKRVLEWSELEKLKEYRKELLEDDPRSPRPWAIDMFFFSLLTGGVNMADIVRLERSDITGKWLRFVRKKTERTAGEAINVPLTPEAVEIIERQGTKEGKYIFPLLKDGGSELENRKNVIKRLNTHLKETAKALGLEPFTSYSARHTAATLLMREGTPVAHIQKMLGHTSTLTTEHYLGDLNDEQARKNYQILSGEK